MTLIREAYIVWAHTEYFPQLLHRRSELQPWARDIERRAAARVERLADGRPRRHNVGFLKGIGGIAVPRWDQHFVLKFYESELPNRYVPFEIRPHWKIPDVQIGDSRIHLTLRSHLYADGACVVLSTAHFRNSSGTSCAEFIRIVRSLARSTDLRLIVEKRGAPAMAASRKELVTALSTGIGNALLLTPAPAPVPGREYTMIDVYSSTPKLEPNAHASEILGLLRMEPRFADFRSEGMRRDFGRFLGDVGSISRGSFVFAQKKTMWPGRPYREALAWRRTQTWKLFRAVEFHEAQMVRVSYLQRQFDSLVQQMHAANNRSADLLKTMMKSTFHDRNLVRFAYALDDADQHVHGCSRRIYNVLSGKSGLREKLVRLRATVQDFERLCDVWIPGIGRIMALTMLGKR